MAEFDPYLSWLDIPPHQRPPSHYRLLGVRPGEADAATIAAAADRVAAHVRRLAADQQAAWREKLLVEIRDARECLVDSKRKAAYDAELAARQPVRPGPIKPPPPVPAGPCSGDDGPADTRSGARGQESRLAGPAATSAPPTIRPAPPPPTAPSSAAGPQATAAPGQLPNGTLASNHLASLGAAGWTTPLGAAGHAAVPMAVPLTAGTAPAPPPPAPPALPPPARPAAQSVPPGPVGSWIPAGRQGRVGTSIAEIFDGPDQPPRKRRLSTANWLRRRTQSDFSQLTVAVIVTVAIAFILIVVTLLAVQMR